MNNWISVEDRLPDVDREVLINSHGFCYVTYHCGEYWETEDLECSEDSITHWQPLPEPPKQ